MKTYYIIQIRISGRAAGYREFLARRERYYQPYGSRAVPMKWYRTDSMDEAEQFDTPGRARSIAKKIKIVREIVHCGGAWEILRVTKEVVEASDDPALLKLARAAK